MRYYTVEPVASINLLSINYPHIENIQEFFGQRYSSLENLISKLNEKGKKAIVVAEKIKMEIPREVLENPDEMPSPPTELPVLGLSAEYPDKVLAIIYARED